MKIESRPQPDAGLEDPPVKLDERHLCTRCSHHVVCRVVAAADPNLAIVIAACLAFEPAEPDSGPAARWRRVAQKTGSH
jgi:hypothetical protein